MKKATLQKIALSALIFVAGYACTQKNNNAKMPQSAATAALNIQSPQITELPNGLTLMVVENNQLPRVNIMLMMDTPADFEGDKAGKNTILAQMLGAGTQQMTKEIFNDSIDFLGATLQFNDEGASASALSRYFPQILELMSAAILQPKFSPAEFDLVREMSIEEMKNKERDVAEISKKLFPMLTFGADSPYGEFATPQTIQNISLGDIVALHKQKFVANHAYLAIVGDVKFDDVKPLVEKAFGTWKKGNVSAPAIAKAQNPEEVEINVIDVPSAMQSTITIGNVHDLKLNNPLFFAAELSNSILGGNSLNTRLNSNLREKNGFTYGVGSRVSYDKYNPSFAAEASVSNPLVAKAIKEFMIEFNNIATITADELADAKARAKGAFTLSMEGPESIAGMEMNILTEDLPKDFYVNYLQNIDKVTLNDVQEATKAYLHPANLRILVVGKASEFRKDIEKLGYVVKYFDTQGNRIR